MRDAGRFLLFVLLLAGLVLLALTLLSRRSGPAPAVPPRQPTPASPAPEPPAPSPPPRAPEPTPPPVPAGHRSALRVEGPTRFVRRLAAGSHLRRLAGEIRAPAADRAAVYEDFLPLKRYLLAADGDPPRDLEGALLALTEPRRDRERLTLHEGARGLLRVWTLEPEFPASTVEHAGWLLERLGEVAGRRAADGIDLLVTPRMGADLFPGLRRSGAAGIYFGDDRFCVVRSTLPPSYRAEVVKHEMIHAYVHATAPALMGRRLIAEGLAEYLRFLNPSDTGFRIPREAFRNNLARLDHILTFYEDLGCDLREIRPQRLVSLPPWLFYRLPFGYELAQATLAYVGGDIVEKALADRFDQVLVDAIRVVEWEAFRQWMKEGARGGNAAGAVVVGDADPAEVGAAESRGETVWSALEAIGVRLPRRPEEMDAAADDALRSPERLAAVLRMILAYGGEPVVIATDLSAAMDGALGPVALPAVLEAGPDFPSASPRDFVTGLHGLLAARTGTAPLRVGLCPEPEPLDDLRTALPYAVDALPEWLAKSGLQRIRLVLCVAQAEPDRERSARLSRMLRQLDVAPAAVLVIDLAPGAPGEAWTLARALAQGGRAPTVAYWRPRD